MGARLIRDTDGREWPVIESCILGRSSSAEIDIQDESVSRHHAMIREVKGKWMFFDLDSVNGSRVNGQPVSKPIELNHFDSIAIGNSLFKFTIDEAGLDTDQLAQSKGMTMLEEVRLSPMTLLAADVVGYSTISERLPAHEVAGLLRTWSKICRDILEEEGATIGNIVGDAVFAYWGSTSFCTRESAVSAAFQLVDIFDPLSGEQSDLLRANGLLWKCGVGLHIGEATVGALSRGSLSPAGTQVNLAFGIESLTRSIGKDILVSKPFLAGWSYKKAVIESVGEHQVKGFTNPVPIFSVARRANGEQ